MDIENLKKAFEYNAETGIIIKKETNRIVGFSKSPDKYGSVWFEGKTLLAHRLVWVLVHGCFPEKGFEIDHLNHKRNDNRLINLQVVTKAENLRRMNAKHAEARAEKKRKYGHLKNWSAKKVVDLEKLLMAQKT